MSNINYKITFIFRFFTECIIIHFLFIMIIYYNFYILFSYNGWDKKLFSFILLLNCHINMLNMYMNFIEDLLKCLKWIISCKALDFLFHSFLNLMDKSLGSFFYYACFLLIISTCLHLQEYNHYKTSYLLHYILCNQGNEFLYLLSLCFCSILITC